MSGLLPDGLIVKGDASDAVYLIHEGAKRHYHSAGFYHQLHGNNWSLVTTIDQSIMDKIPLGPPMAQNGLEKARADIQSARSSLQQRAQHVNVYCVRYPLLDIVDTKYAAHVGLLLVDPRTGEELEVHRVGDGRKVETTGKGGHSSSRLAGGPSYQYMGTADGSIKELVDWNKAWGRGRPYVLGKDDCFTHVMAFCDKFNLPYPDIVARDAEKRGVAVVLTAPLSATWNSLVDISQNMRKGHHDKAAGNILLAPLKITAPVVPAPLKIPVVRAPLKIPVVPAPLKIPVVPAPKEDIVEKPHKEVLKKLKSPFH